MKIDEKIDSRPFNSYTDAEQAAKTNKSGMGAGWSIYKHTKTGKHHVYPYSTSSGSMHMKHVKDISEDAPTNSTGAAIAGTTGNTIVKNQPNVFRRKKFAGHDVFEVTTDVYHRCHLGKRKYLRYEKYVGNDAVGEEIRKYGRENPKNPIIVQDETTGALTFLKYKNR